MLAFDRVAMEVIKQHSNDEVPNEACGILAGKQLGNEKAVTDVVKCSNVDVSPKNAYTIDSAELLKTIIELESSQSIEHIGFYHSHPFSSPNPSMVDLNRATWDGFIYAIYSVPENRFLCFQWLEEKKVLKPLKFSIR